MAFFGEIQKDPGSAVDFSQGYDRPVRERAPFSVMT